MTKITRDRSAKKTLHYAQLFQTLAYVAIAPNANQADTPCPM